MIWSRRRALKEYWTNSNLVIYPQGEVTKKLMAEKEIFLIEMEEGFGKATTNESVNISVGAEDKTKEEGKSKTAVDDFFLKGEEDLMAAITQSLKNYVI